MNRVLAWLICLLLATYPAAVSAQGVMTLVGAGKGTPGTPTAGLSCSYTPVTSATYNVAYTGATPSASGGTPAYTFSQTGTLPPGFTINTGTGVISGTDSVDSGGATYPGIQVKVADTIPTTVNCGSSFTITVAAGASYVGVGDIVSGATAYVGLRAYNAAYATGSNNAVQVRRASDNTLQNIVILSNGNLDTASAATFAGTDATCTGTAPGTTALALTSCSSTPHAGSTLTSTGGTGSFTQPAYIVSCGSFAGGAGTCTLNVAQTVTTVSVTATYGLYIRTGYDQSGNGNNVTQTTNGNQPQLLFSCLGSLPCMSFVAANVQALTGTTASITNTSEIITSLRIFHSAFDTMIGRIAAGNISFNSSANQLVFNAITLAATDNAWHAVQANNNGASSFVYSDGTTSSMGTVTAGAATTFNIGANQTGTGNVYNGYMTEAAVWGGVNFTGTQVSNLCHNQFAYWGTSVSC